MLGSVSRRKADLVSRSGLARASPMMVREADSSIGCNTRGLLVENIYVSFHTSGRILAWATKLFNEDVKTEMSGKTYV